MLAIVLCLVAATTAVDPLALPDPQDLDGFVAYAMATHPALESAAAGRAAVAAGVDRAGSLPDPVFIWGEMIEPVETRLGPQQRVLSLKQSLPWPGTLGAQSDAASVRAAAAASDERLAAVMVAADVRRAWARAAWLSETRSVTERQLELVRSLESAVRAGYEAGETSYGDLLQIQLEIARLADRLRGLDEDTIAVRAGLNAALGREPRAPLDLPESLPATSTVAAAAGVHPRLTALDHDAESARLDAVAAQRAGRPVISLGVDWIQVGEAVDPELPGSGRDAWVARFGLSIPLWRGKYDGAAAAADARAASLQAARRAEEHTLAARREAAAAALRDARRRRALHENELLPLARQAYDVVLAGYRAGGSNFADVLAAERALLDLEQGLLAARRDLVVAAADLDEANGMVPAAFADHQE